MADLTILADGLLFPEGPVACSDGSVLLVEIERRTITRVSRRRRGRDRRRSSTAARTAPPSARTARSTSATTAASCSRPIGGFNRVKPGVPEGYAGGWIERVDLATGARRDALHPLRRASAGRAERHRVRPAWRLLLHRFRQDPSAPPAELGGALLRAGRRLAHRRGRLSPDHAERRRRCRRTAARSTSPRPRPAGSGPSTSRRRASRRAIPPRPHGGRLVCGLPGYQRLDSLAVDADGNICVATLITGCITVIGPDGEVLEQVPTGDPITTNICFGGPDRRPPTSRCPGWASSCRCRRATRPAARLGGVRRGA